MNYPHMETPILNGTDQFILEGCRRKNRESQRLLYEKYFEPLSWVCMRYLRNGEEVYDLVHEGFIKIFKNIHKYSGKGSLEGWMKRIVINNCLDYLRKINQRPPDVPLTEVYDLELDENMLADLEAEYILDLLQELVPLYRMVFNLSVIEGYPHKEIASILKIKESTSRAYLTAAKKEIRQKLAAM